MKNMFFSIFRRKKMFFFRCLLQGVKKGHTRPTLEKSCGEHCLSMPGQVKDCTQVDSPACCGLVHVIKIYLKLKTRKGLHSFYTMYYMYKTTTMYSNISESNFFHFQPLKELATPVMPYSECYILNNLYALTS